MNDTIADVIREHRMRNTTSRHPRLKSVIVNVTGCIGCGWRTVAINDEGKSQHAAHVADAIRAALGLTERFTWSWPEHLTTDGRPGYGYEVDTAAEAATEADLSYMTVVSRLVSDWRPVDA